MQLAMTILLIKHFYVDTVYRGCKRVNMVVVPRSSIYTLYKVFLDSVPDLYISTMCIGPVYHIDEHKYNHYLGIFRVAF
jgi:hypothetical protein